MQVLFATAEMAPVARVGGMGLATAGLVKQLRADGVDVTVVLPDYGDAELIEEASWDLDVPTWVGPTRARRGRLVVDGRTDDHEIVLVDRRGLARPHPYVDPTTGTAWPDNDWRFIGFGAAVAALARSLELCPNNAWVHYNRGLLFYEQGHPRAAAESFQAAISCQQPALTPRKRKRARAFLARFQEIGLPRQPPANRRRDHQIQRFIVSWIG